MARAATARLVLCGLIVSVLTCAGLAEAQVGSFSKDDLIESDGPLEGRTIPRRASEGAGRKSGAHEAGDPQRGGERLARQGLPPSVRRQLDQDQPDKVLVGRAVTVQFMPLRDDMNQGNAALAKAKRRQVRYEQGEPVPCPHQYDVPVVNLFGKGEHGTYIGDNFATQIFVKTGTGIVVDGNIIDIEGYRELPYFPYSRVNGTQPDSTDVMVTSTNAPIMIGGAPRPARRRRPWPGSGRPVHSFPSRTGCRRSVGAGARQGCVHQGEPAEGKELLHGNLGRGDQAGISEVAEGARTGAHAVPAPKLIVEQAF